jgi:hypothetical protein
MIPKNVFFPHLDGIVRRCTRAVFCSCTITTCFTLLNSKIIDWFVRLFIEILSLLRKPYHLYTRITEADVEVQKEFRSIQYQMQNTTQHTNQKYNGIEPLTPCFVNHSGIAVTFHNDSHSNRMGFFITIGEKIYVSITQRLQIRVYHYAVISSLPNRANLKYEMLKKAYR